MRKITQQATEYFLSAMEFSSGNTQVKVEDGIVSLYLHGNKIAYRKKNFPNDIFISLAGWNTNTTKEILKGITRVFSKKGKIYFENYKNEPVEIKDTYAFYSIWEDAEE